MIQNLLKGKAREDKPGAEGGQAVSGVCCQRHRPDLLSPKKTPLMSYGGDLPASIPGPAVLCILGRETRSAALTLDQEGQTMSTCLQPLLHFPLLPYSELVYLGLVKRLGSSRLLRTLPNATLAFLSLSGEHC